MKIFAKTDIGLVRSSNEDNYLVINKDDNAYVAIVCDGMGGHVGGAYASNETCKILGALFEDLFENGPGNRSLGSWIYDAIQQANAAIYGKSISDDNYRGMGTTVTGVIKYKDEIFYVHIGDSRLYLFDKYAYQQVTTDHTYVNSLLINGLITYKQSLKHPQRHVLTNALGIKREVSVDISILKIREDDSILLCSDGLYNLVDDKKIFKILNEDKTIEEKAIALNDKALKNGGTDNITMIILEK